MGFPREVYSIENTDRQTIQFILDYVRERHPSYLVHATVNMQIADSRGERVRSTTGKNRFENAEKLAAKLVRDFERITRDYLLRVKGTETDIEIIGTVLVFDFARK